MTQFAHAWLGLIVDISIKSLGLAGLAGLTLFVLRVRDTNLRHRVWTAVLFGMLAMPALVFVTPAIPLPRWLNIAIPEATAETLPVGDNADGRLIATPPRRTTNPTSDAMSVAASESDAIPDPMMSGRSPPAPDALRPAVANDLPTKDSVLAGAPVAGRPSVAVQIASRLPVVLASLYFAVVAIFATRLITGLWLTYRLIRQARQMNLPAISASPRRSLRFLESELIHVPATVGFLRPVVLLPASWRQWSETKLRAVLAHELAHVRRADWLVITLAELNRAIYWFHPLAWFLRRRLSELAELNCDDAVLEADGDRTQYARHLLEVASSLTAAGSRYRPPLQGVAMARKPNVETRIDAILDAGRPLARRLSVLGAIVLLVSGATAVLLAAALRTDAEDKPAKSPGESKQRAPAESGSAPREDKKGATVSKQADAKGGALGRRRGQRRGGPCRHELGRSARSARNVDSLGDPLPEHARLRLGTLRFRPPSGIDDIALSPDEKSVVTVGKELIVWDAATGKERWRAERSEYGIHVGASYGVRAVAFSPESSRFFTPGKQDQIIAWDINSGHRTVITIKEKGDQSPEKPPIVGTKGMVIAGAQGQCLAIDVTNDGSLFAIGRSDGVVVCHPDGQVLYQIANKHKREIDFNSRDRLTFSGDSSLVRFSPFGRMLAIVTSDTPNVIRFVESETGQELQRCKLGSRLVRMAFSPDGKQIATTERDTFVRLYDVGSGKEVWTHSVRLSNPYENYTSGIVFAPNGKAVAACATDNSIYLLDAGTGEEMGRFVGTHWNPWGIAFTADGKMLYSSGWDGVLRRWDVASQKQLDLPQGFRATATCAISPNGRLLACADDSDAVRLFDADTGKERRKFKLPGAGFDQLTFSPDSRELAGGGIADDKVQVTVWDLASGETVRHWDWPKGRDPHSTVESLGFTPDGNRLAAAVFRQNLAYLWDMTTGKQVAELKHSEVYGLSFSPNGKTLATAGWDSIVRFWDAESGKRVREFEVRQHREKGDAKGGRTDSTEEADLRNGIPHEDLRMYTVCYSPAGGLIATAHMDGLVQVWKADDMTLQTRFNIGGSFVYGAMSFSPDGSWLATGGSADVALWNPLTGEKATDVGRHQHFVYTVGFGRDARTLLSGGDDGVCYLWDVPLPAQRSNTTPDRATITMPPGAGMEMKLPAKSEGADARAKETTAQEGHPTGTAAGSSGDKQYHVHGRVLDPDRRPVSGATVYAARATHGTEPSFRRIEDKNIAQTKTDSRGNYELTFLESHPDRNRINRGWYIAAFAPGFGPSWCRGSVVVENERTDGPTNFDLTSDKSVRGRFVDLEGNPLAGVHVRVYGLRKPENARSIDDWLEDSKKKHAPANLADYFHYYVSAHGFYQSGYSKDSSSPYPGPFPLDGNDGMLSRGSLALPADAMTDQDGRVEFTGLGADRLLILEIQGPTISTALVQVVTRSMSSLSAQPSASIGDLTGTYYGGDFQFVAGPAQAIVGKVNDAETGEPLRNLDVFVAHVAGAGQLSQRDFLTTRTDDKGRYRLDGAARGGGHAVMVSPTIDEPYFPIERVLDRVAGFGPITCDFALRRGRWITGKVTNRETKAPIKGAVVEYLPLRDNEHAKDYPNYDPNIAGQVPAGRYDTSADGTFRVLAIPGRGILAAIDYERSERNTYLTLSKEMAPKDLVQDDGILKTYHPGQITDYHALKVVDLPESNETTKHDLELTPGLTRSVKLVDARGEPVKGVRALGRVFPPSFEEPTKESSVEVIGLRPNDKRDVVFIHPERRIGNALTIAPGDELTVELQPCAVARGRVVNEVRQPVRDLPIRLSVENRADMWSRELAGAKTGSDGRFEIVLPPGTTYRIWHYETKPAEFDVSAECRPNPGAVFELGDLTNGTKLTTEQTDKMIVKASTPTAQESRPTGGETRTAGQSTIHGRIAGVDGKPAAGVDVAVIGRRTAVGRGGDLEPMGAVLGESKTDSGGRYQIELAGVSSKTHRDANVIARASGSALAWKKLNLDAGDVETSFELQPEETIPGRLVDIEGQPAAGVRFEVSGVSSRVAQGKFPTGVALWPIFSYPRTPAAWPQPIVTDGEGRFVIRSVPKDHVVGLEVEGDDRFAPQEISLNSGMAEQRGERDGTYRPLIKNFKPGEEAVLPLAPAQLFTGTVRYEDTGEPAPHARLTIWSSQQKFGSMFSLAGKANEKGEYQISANPGIRFGVAAYPPDGAPYLVRQINDISWEHGAKSKVVDVALPRGVLIQGKVLEEGSDTPIAGASVQYHAEEANNTNKSDSILTGWQDIHLSDNEGRFHIVVLPGPGRLLVHAPGDNYVMQETSGQELYKGKPGGLRNYAHAIEKVDPAPDSAPPEILIRLKRGATVRGELVDQEGKPVDQAEFFSQLHINAASLWWRGFGVEARGGRFEIGGLAPDREYPVCFLDSKRRLGATLSAKAGMPTPRVVLEPCGSATMRFVDDASKPVAKYEPTVELVVTPGALQYSQAAMNAGMLAADADFIANVDRANHSLPENSDDQGRLTVRALIPGATYRVITYRKNEFVLSKEFKAVAKETNDLGDIVVERRE